MGPKVMNFRDIEPVAPETVSSVPAINSMKSENAKEAHLFGIIKGLLDTVDLLKAKVLSLEAKAVHIVEPVDDTVKRLVVPMLEGVSNPSVEKFEESVRRVVDPIVVPLSQEVTSLRTDLDLVNNRVSENFVAVSRVDQYSRRGTITVVGHPQRPSEDIVADMCALLKVDEVDLEAAHRNGSKPFTFTRQDGSVGTKPPSITVRFRNLTKKDQILRTYKNYSNGKAKPVRVYQSLTQTYKDLKYDISKYCGEAKIELAWIHWRSASAGLVVKVKSSGKLYNKIFCYQDFLSKFTGSCDAPKAATAREPVIMTNS